MFISTLDLFKIGIGPSSSHTLGPMLAAYEFRQLITVYLRQNNHAGAKYALRCVLMGSLAHTGPGHRTPQAVLLGLHGYRPHELVALDFKALLAELSDKSYLLLDSRLVCAYETKAGLVFDTTAQNLPHPNTLRFELYAGDELVFSVERYSIGGGFVTDAAGLHTLAAPIKFAAAEPYPFPFENAEQMLTMAGKSGVSIARMKQANEACLYRQYDGEAAMGMANVVSVALMKVWAAMKQCLECGLVAKGMLPGGLKVKRRAAELFSQAEASGDANINDYLCAYAMAVNEENAAGHMVVTAPTNGAAGVIPAVLYYFWRHEHGSQQAIMDFLLTAGAIGGLIKHNSSISGAEVGCQGEVGSAAAMAAAGLCAVKGGTPEQVENAAEIALEHHLGMTCDPVKGLVQVPCIERNGFGAIKAYTAASLALMGTGEHVMSLDKCIIAMRETGKEMSTKYKETALGGLAQSWTEC